MTSSKGLQLRTCRMVTPGTSPEVVDRKNSLKCRSTPGKMEDIHPSIHPSVPPPKKKNKKKNQDTKPPPPIGQDTNPPLLLEVRTPIAKAIWGRNPYSKSHQVPIILRYRCFLPPRTPGANGLVRQGIDALKIGGFPAAPFLWKWIIFQEIQALRGETLSFREGILVGWFFPKILI